MVRAAPLLGPIVFFIFVLITSIVLVNIFLTLIISAFETVKHDVMKQDNEYEIVEFMAKKIKSMFGLYDFSAETKEVVDEKERKLRLLEERITYLPEKIDHMLRFVDKVYYKGQLDTSNKLGGRGGGQQQTPAISNNSVGSSDNTGRATRFNRRNRRRSNHPNGNNNNNNLDVVHSPRFSFLDWSEIED